MRLSCIGLLTCLLIGSTAAAEKDIDSEKVAEAVKLLLGADDQQQDQARVAAAWQHLAGSSADQLPMILQNMRGVGPIADNWFRAAIDAIAERTLADGDKLPVTDLEKFVLDSSQSPRARRVAFEWLERVDKSARRRLIPGMLDDPSLELRYDAVAAQLEKAKKLEGKARQVAFRKALDAARDLNQVKQCVAAFKEQGVEIDIAGQLGFVRDWQLVGTFENKDGAGYEKAYPPERKLDFSADYESDGQKVSWTKQHTDHELGEVDLNKVFGEIKGVLAYAASEIEVPEARDAQVRISSITACKVWVNGKLVANHEVYHAGSQYDQYIANVQLKPGKNTILMKLCQNEQTESWANVWKFALRVCDPLGGRIPSVALAESRTKS